MALKGQDNGVAMHMWEVLFMMNTRGILHLSSNIRVLLLRFICPSLEP